MIISQGLIKADKTNAKIISKNFYKDKTTLNLNFIEKDRRLTG